MACRDAPAGTRPAGLYRAQPTEGRLLARSNGVTDGWSVVQHRWVLPDTMVQKSIDK